jgi:hypothetical protein
VSVAQPPSTVPTAAPPPAGEACPLCGGALDPEQEWCLHCGAAARTRLAASPAWKAPVIALAVITALSLGVLAAALVTLAGGSGHSTTAPVTVIVTTAPATAPTTTTIPPTTSTTTTVPSTSTPSAARPDTSTSGATTPDTSTAPGLTTPSTATTPAPTTPSGVTKAPKQ